MRATISRTAIFRAAANIANGGYRRSILQIGRRGDMLSICGTNSYVAVIADVDADFSRWPDGEHVRFNGGDVQSFMRGIGKAMKYAESLSIDVDKDAVTFGLLVNGSEVSAKIEYDKIGAGPLIRDFGKMGILGEEIDGDPCMASHMMAIASNAMRTISPSKKTSWRIRQHGRYNAVEYIAEYESARVLVMPTVITPVEHFLGGAL